MIQITNLSKTYKKNEVFRDINFKLEQGDFATIIGQSGAGKSTLLNILGLLLNYTDGEYLFENQNIKSFDAKQLQEFRSKSISFVFQDFLLMDELTVLDNICLPLIFAGMDKNLRETKALELATKLGIEQKLQEYPETLSGGQIQRVAIARALITSPKVILADEPTGNLDWDNKQIVAELLVKLNTEGTTIILITHDRDLAKLGNRHFEIKSKTLLEY